MTAVPSPPAYNPAQQDVVDQLGASRADRPTFDPGLRHELRADLEAGLEPIVPLLDDLGVTAEAAVHVSKHQLTQVHGCEAHLLATEAEPFAWTVPTARGTVAHKAIEVSLNVAARVPPATLVDEALARLTETDRSLSAWLQAIDPVERAELRADAVDKVTKFVECWPRLKPEWTPVTESRWRGELLDGRVQLHGKVDLTIGTPVGSTAGKVVVDLKTGRTAPHHLDDLRFYALIELLRLGVPPRRLATYYLDSGSFLPEDVTEPLLRATVARVVDGVVKLVELRAARREPVLRPGAACRWCPLAETCEEGRGHLEALDDGW